MHVCACERAGAWISDAEMGESTVSQPASVGSWARAPAGMCGSPEVDHHGGELQLMSP